MAVVKLMVCLMACVTSGAGQGVTITIAIEDQHLLVETGSPNIMFNATVNSEAITPLYDDLQFQTGDGKTVASPSGKEKGPVMVVNDVYKDQFEILDTNLPLVSIKLNNPDMKLHTKVFRWTTLRTVNDPHDVPLIVSDRPNVTFPNEINENEETQIKCSVRFGLLPQEGNAIEKINITSMIGSDTVLDAMGQIEDDTSETGVVTRIYTYNHRFQNKDNGKPFLCEARLTEFPGHKLTNTEPLNVLYPPSNISFGESVKDRYVVGQQINCSADGNPGPASYQWTDLESHNRTVRGQTLDITEEMDGYQIWMCEAIYATGQQINKSITFNVDEPPGPSTESTTIQTTPVELVETTQNTGSTSQPVEYKKTAGPDNTVAIAVGVTVGLLVLVIVGVAGFLWYRKYHKNKDSDDRPRNTTINPAYGDSGDVIDAQYATPIPKAQRQNYRGNGNTQAHGGDLYDEVLRNNQPATMQPDVNYAELDRTVLNTNRGSPRSPRVRDTGTEYSSIDHNRRVSPQPNRYTDEHLYTDF